MARRPIARPTSLLAALFGRVGVLFLIITLVVGALAFFTAQRRINEIYDGQLIIGANVLRALMTDEIKGQAAQPGGAPSAAGQSELTVDDSDLLSPEDRQAFDNYADWRMFRIWRGPRVVLRSDTGPTVTAPPAQNGFSEIKGAQDRWRVYTLHVASSNVTVQIGERMDIRLVLVQGIALGLVLPLLLLIPMGALLIWLTLSDGLQALRTLIAEIGRRTMRDLSPLPLDPWPRDLHPLVRSINRLFERIDRSLQNERRFLDDAAHQLRTPLAAVKLQAQLIAGEADPAERQAMTAQLVQGVDRASALTDSLLTLARLEARRAATEAGEGDLRAETVAALADLAPVAARRQVELSFDGAGRYPGGDPVLLRLIAANLVENAINHAPEGSEVAVRLSTAEGWRRLSVDDAGPGIAAAERAKVLERFYRGASAAPKGSGLGLSIVGEAVRLLGGRMELRDREDGARGLCAVVELPALRAAKA
jgi:signal transduction histidine kinase